MFSHYSCSALFLNSSAFFASECTYCFYYNCPNFCWNNALQSWPWISFLLYWKTNQVLSLPLWYSQDRSFFFPQYWGFNTGPCEALLRIHSITLSPGSRYNFDPCLRWFDIKDKGSSRAVFSPGFCEAYLFHDFVNDQIKAKLTIPNFSRL